MKHRVSRYLIFASLLLIWAGASVGVFLRQPTSNTEGVSLLVSVLAPLVIGAGLSIVGFCIYFALLLLWHAAGRIDVLWRVWVGDRKIDRKYRRDGSLL